MSDHWLDRVDRWLAPAAPARRLALVRITVFGFACAWLVAMGPDLLARARLDPSRFDPVGLAAWPGPVSPSILLVVLGLVLGLGSLALVGRGPAIVAPLFALGLTWLLSHRNSWGHLSHGEHLLVLHVLVLGLSPGRDALRLRDRGPAPPDDARYGFPLRLLMLVTVSTYAIAGLAKLRAGGLAWISGDTVRLHVAHEALRMRMVGDSGSLLGAWLLPHATAFSVTAVGTLVLELGAPLALLGGRLRTAWIAGLWAMHLGIWLVMGIGFPYPLSGVAFVAFFPLERGWDRLQNAWARRRR